MPRAHTFATLRPSTLAAAAIAGALLIGSFAGPALAVGGSEFVSLTNVKRASVGLGPISLSAPVDQIAVERGNQMAAADQLAHNLSYVTTRLGQHQRSPDRLSVSVRHERRAQSRGRWFRTARRLPGT